MSEQHGISLERQGPVAHVRLDRPAARNALDMPMCLALKSAFEEIDTDADLRVVLLGANGPVFCAGADLKERRDRDDAWVRRRRLAAFSAYEAIERCRLPVVAVLDGPVVGSGGEIAMACDFAIASPRVSFRFPEPQWGTVGATQRLQRVIGKRRAKELLFTGRTMPVDEAYGLGLVARIVDDPTAAAQEIGASIAEAPALAIRLTKQAVDLGEELTLVTGIGIEMAAIDRLLADGGWRSGIETFGQTVGASARRGNA